jgi:thiol:disulfide interchange protein
VKIGNPGHKRSLTHIAPATLSLAVFAAIMSCVLTSDPVLAEGSSQNANPDKAARAWSTALPWRRDLRQAMKEAKTNDKMIFIEVYTDWCAPCKMLDANTLSSPDVMTYLHKSYICVKVNADDPALGYWVAAKYQIGSYPSIVVLAPNGKAKGKVIGYCGPQKFLNIMNQMNER